MISVRSASLFSGTGWTRPTKASPFSATSTMTSSLSRIESAVKGDGEPTVAAEDCRFCAPGSGAHANNNAIEESHLLRTFMHESVSYSGPSENSAEGHPRRVGKRPSSSLGDLESLLLVNKNLTKFSDLKLASVNGRRSDQFALSITWR